MIAFDTSGLIKKYVEEEHSDWVDETMAGDDQWFGSMLLACEAPIVSARSAESITDLTLVDRRLTADLDRFSFVPVDGDCLVNAVGLGRAFGLRTLDAIHVAAIRRLPDECRFVTFDERQRQAARALGLTLLTPD